MLLHDSYSKKFKSKNLKGLYVYIKKNFTRTPRKNYKKSSLVSKSLDITTIL